MKFPSQMIEKRKTREREREESAELPGGVCCPTFSFSAPKLLRYGGDYHLYRAVVS